MALVTDVYGYGPAGVLGSEEERQQSPVFVIRSARCEYGGVYPFLVFRLDLIFGDGREYTNLLGVYSPSDSRSDLKEQGYVVLTGLDDYLPAVAVPGIGAGDGYAILPGYTDDVRIYKAACLFTDDLNPHEGKHYATSEG